MALSNRINFRGGQISSTPVELNFGYMGAPNAHSYQVTDYNKTLNCPDSFYKYAKLDATLLFMHNAIVEVFAIDADNNATRIIYLVYAKSGQNTEKISAYGQIPKGTVSIRVHLQEYYGTTFLDPNIVWVSKSTIT